MSTRRLLLPLAFFVFLLSQPSLAEWRLNPQKSQLSFVATKDAHVADNHYFTDIKGRVKNDGFAELIINTNSVETTITKRNEYLRDILFLTNSFPQASVELTLRRSHISPKPAGTSEQIEVTAFVNLIGKSLQQTAKLNVVHLANQEVQVSTLEPVLLDAEDYGMLPAINELRKIAGLKSLTVKVPVSFNLVFEPVDAVVGN